MLKNISNFIRFNAKIIDKVGRIIYTDKQAIRTKEYYKDPRHKELLIDFDLDKNSLVFDVGGFQGNWCSDIYSKYLCEIIVFEPVPAFAKSIQTRFQQNPKIKVLDIGLSDKTEAIQIAIQGEGSSVLNKKEKSSLTEIKLKRAVDYIRENNIPKIDLMKINIEGSEYPLLMDLIENNEIDKIENLLIQFHDFFPDSEEKMKIIQNKLKLTHNLTFQHNFVWEAWKKK